MPFARPLMLFISFGGRLPQSATAIWTVSATIRSAPPLYSCEAPQGSVHAQGLARRAAQRRATFCALEFCGRF